MEVEALFGVDGNVLVMVDSIMCLNFCNTRCRNLFWAKIETLKISYFSRASSSAQSEAGKLPADFPSFFGFWNVLKRVASNFLLHRTLTAATINIEIRKQMYPKETFWRSDGHHKYYQSSQNYMEVEALFGVDGYVLVMANWKSSKCHNYPTAFNGGGAVEECAGNDYNDLSGAGNFIQFEEIRKDVSI